MVEVQRELIDLSDEVWGRLRHRLDGLTDAEYLWEPAPGCWNVRPGPDGGWRLDWPLPRPDPEPFTTIAWRLWHVTDMYGEDRAPRWLGVPPQGEAIGFDGSQGAAATAADAIELLEQAHDRWDAHLALATDELLAQPVGPVGGGYADRSRASYVLHMLDEFIHHGAEIGVLRDLWRWQHPLGVDPQVERAMRGDLTLVDEAHDLDGGELMRTAAQYARWDLVLALLDAGVAVPLRGTSPLHLAAGAGELAVVRRLVEHGADVDGRDDEFHVPAVEWARFLRHPDVVAWLESYAQSN